MKNELKWPSSDIKAAGIFCTIIVAWTLVSSYGEVGKDFLWTGVIFLTTLALAVMWARKQPDKEDQEHNHVDYPTT